MRRQLAPFVFVLAVFATACSGDGGPANTGIPVSNAAPVTTSASSRGCTADTATDLSGNDPFNITIAGFAFHPACFTAATASSIVIKNKDEVPHSFTIDETPVDIVVGGGTTEAASLPLEPGTYEFRCTFHPPSMVGTVVVS